LTQSEEERERENERDREQRVREQSCGKAYTLWGAMRSMRSPKAKREAYACVSLCVSVCVFSF